LLPPPLEIKNSKLFQCRWQIEIFFKWIKQHLRIKAFCGTTENAVKTQIWIAITIHVLAAIVKKQIHYDLSLNAILQILSVTVFAKKAYFRSSLNCSTQRITGCTLQPVEFIRLTLGQDCVQVKITEVTI